METREDLVIESESDGGRGPKKSNCAWYQIVRAGVSAEEKSAQVGAFLCSCKSQGRCRPAGAMLIGRNYEATLNPGIGRSYEEGTTDASFLLPALRCVGAHCPRCKGPVRPCPTRC